MKTEISPLKLSVHDSIIPMKLNVDHSSMEASLKEFGFKDPIKVVSIEVSRAVGPSILAEDPITRNNFCFAILIPGNAGYFG